MHHRKQSKTFRTVANQNNKLFILDDDHSDEDTQDTLKNP